MVETLSTCWAATKVKLIKWLVLSSLRAQYAFVLGWFGAEEFSKLHCELTSFFVRFDKSKLPSWQLQPQAKNTATVGARRTRITAYQRWKLRGAEAVAAKADQAFRVLASLPQLGTVPVEVGALPHIGGRLNMRFTEATALQLGTVKVEIEALRNTVWG